MASEIKTIVADEATVEALAIAIFEAEEDENDEACAANRESAASIGPRTGWNDEINQPVQAAFRTRACRILANLPDGLLPREAHEPRADWPFAQPTGWLPLT